MPPVLRISTASTEYVTVPVQTKQAGTVVDPTGLTVQFAFKTGDTTPSGGDWTAGSWETDATTNPDTYYARVLVGPGATVLAAGTYRVWVKVTDNPELPARPVGWVVIY